MGAPAPGSGGRPGSDLGFFTVAALARALGLSLEQIAAGCSPPPGAGRARSA